METEAYAFREAIVQVKRWGLQGVTFCGDAKEIYGKLNCQRQAYGVQQWNHHELVTYLREICLLADPKLHYNFMFIKREANQAVDTLAKYARSISQSYVVSWNTNV